MRLFGKPSIKIKLVVLATISGALALALACAGFVYNDVRLMRAAKLRQLQTQADILGFNSTAAVLVGDSHAATQLLSSLNMQPSIELAILYDEEEHEVARFVHEGSNYVPTLNYAWEGYRFTDDDHLEISISVYESSSRVGRLYLSSNMDDLHAQLRDYSIITAVVMACSLLASLLFSVIWQRGLSKPILDLAETARRITVDANYSVRVCANRNDELGTLYNAFNQMLDRVQSSENALKEAHDELEERVFERTAQLVSEITQRENVQQELIQAMDAAVAASRAKSEFLANMSHEIRTPLNAILGFTDLLRRGADRGNEAERRDFIDTVHHSGQHLLSLINDVLDLSKIEAGQLQIERLVCSPSQIIGEVIALLKVRADEKGLNLTCTWHSEVPGSIVTDPARYRQLLLNVIGNAVKFTDEGGVQVRARLQRAGDQAQLVVNVIDTGIGIPADKLSSIFDPFCQADTSVTRRFGGTGLGLSICRRIAVALGGEVAVESQEGIGSTFTLTVAGGPWDKIQFVPADAVGQPAANAPADDEFEPLPTSARILVADDADPNRRLIRVVLDRAGLQVATAENGRLAVEAALAERFDVILMDMQMPEMDGYTATARLREAGLTMPIIALTAHAMKGDEQRCREAGCSGYLTKPIDPEWLIRAIADALRQQPIESSAMPVTHVERSPSQEMLVSTLPLDDPEFREIVAEFIERLSGRTQAMRAAWNAGDFGELISLAHWLKGAGGTAGFMDLTRCAAKLENAARQHNPAAAGETLIELDELVSRIERGFRVIPDERLSPFTTP